jgi:hypothetical protein
MKLPKPLRYLRNLMVYYTPAYQTPSSTSHPLIFLSDITPFFSTLDNVTITPVFPVTYPQPTTSQNKHINNTTHHCHARTTHHPPSKIRTWHRLRSPSPFCTSSRSSTTPPAPTVEEPDTAVSTAAEQGFMEASVRVTTSGAAGVEDGQLEHVIVDSARAVSWRAIGWVSWVCSGVFSSRFGYGRGRYRRG